MGGGTIVSLKLTEKEKSILSRICENYLDSMDGEEPGPFVRLCRKIIEWVECGE